MEQPVRHATISPSTAVPPADAVLPTTRWLAAAITPFLLIAFGILYVFPGDTERLFAWTIRPPISAILMGAGYVSGAYFFLRVVFATNWHSVTLGFPPVATFASLLGITTFAHWDRFNHGHVTFWAWTVIYILAPILVLAAWLYNRRTDPGDSIADARRFRGPLRAVFVVFAIAGLSGAAMFALFPQVMIPLWSWELTPLTARVLGGWFALSGVAALALALDARWSAARIPIQTQMIGQALILIGLVRAWQDVNPQAISTWLFFGGLGVMLLFFAVLTLVMDRRPRASAIPAE